MYIANHYVKVGRVLYRKGDTIPALSPHEEEWLLKASAITKIDSPVSLEEEPSEEKPEVDAMEGIKPKRGRRKKVSDEDKAD